MPDSNKAVGQAVKQEALNKRYGGDCEGAIRILFLSLVMKVTNVLYISEIFENVKFKDLTPFLIPFFARSGVTK